MSERSVPLIHDIAARVSDSAYSSSVRGVNDGVLYGAVSKGDAISKTQLMIGAEGMERLKDATVMVVGLGGVGSHCAEALGRAGVGGLILIDHDSVGESNINRQAIAFRSTLGRKKIQVMAEMLRDINPDCRVITRDMFVLPENLDVLFEGVAPDYVLDCIDTITSKLALALYCQERGIKIMSSMGAGNKFDPLQFRFDDLYATKNCPLCKVMRYEGRHCGIRELRVLYSTERPMEIPSDPGALRKERSNLGTMSYMPACMGLMLASDVIRSIVER